jgi:large subunit ribosomal protein L15
MDISGIKVKTRAQTPKRLGRGSGSGWGKTSGRGNKGAGSRSGKTLPYVGFMGGNIPYIRKLPKRGFNASDPVEYQIVNLNAIEVKLKNSDVIDPETLEKAGLIKHAAKPVKILGKINKDFTVKASFRADIFSSGAIKAIEKAGGKTEIRKAA